MYSIHMADCLVHKNQSSNTNTGRAFLLPDNMNTRSLERSH